MSLNVTTYASNIPAMAGGLVKMYASMSDPLVVSGLLKNDNTEFVGHTLGEGVEVKRMATIGATVKNRTTYNRSGFVANKQKSVTMAAYPYVSGNVDTPTMGATDDPARLASILNDPNPSSQGAEYIRHLVGQHAYAVYQEYISTFVSKLFGIASIKTDYDNTTGAGGQQVTFENDCPHTDAVMTTDFNGPGSWEEKGFSFLKEINDFSEDLYDYTAGSIKFVTLPAKVFTTVSTHLNYALSSRRRSNDTESSGTMAYGNSNYFSVADNVFVKCPNKKFPTSQTTDADDTYDCCILSPDAIRVFFSLADLYNDISILKHGFSSMPDASSIITAMQGSISNPYMQKIFGAMGADQAANMFREDGTFGLNVLPNIVKTYITEMGAGTNNYAEYFYTRAELDMGVVRANPGAMRKFKVLKTLI